MKRLALKTYAGLILAAALQNSCGAPAAPTGSPNVGSLPVTADPSKPNTGTGTEPQTPAPTTKKPVTTAAQLQKSNDFFINKMLPLFKGVPCSDCHNAPRNLKDPNVNGGTGILEHNKMFALLKDGRGANDNKLINKLLDGSDHTGGKQCKDEASQPCATIKEWYKTVFGDGVLSLGKIEGINREGVISGWAGNIDAPTTSYEIKFYLDGEKGVGAALPSSAMANLDAFDNALSGPHAFSLKVPDALIDGKPHKIWAYTSHNGTDVMLSGSPFSYTAFKAKGAAGAPAFAQIGFNGCNGQCHNFVYESRWGTLLGNGMDGQWSATSNSLYDKLSGKLGHGGGGLPGGINLQAVATWFTQEFGTP